MKKLISLAGLLLLAGSLGARPIVVYAQGDFTELRSGGATPVPAEPARAAFLASFQADLGHPAEYTKPSKLGPPPEFGRPVPGARGEIQFHPTFPRGLVMSIMIQGLTPNHRYVLMLKGSPYRAGNQYLTEGGPAETTGRYYDFLTITTSPQGHYRANLGLFLPPGFYDTQFCVKDTDDSLVVLYRDFFKFTVE